MTPVYRFDPSVAFTEVPKYKDGSTQSTTDSMDSVSAITLAMAYLLKGASFTGTSNITSEQIVKEVTEFCEGKLISIDRLLDWAESIAIEPDVTLTDLSYVPTYMKGVDFKLDQYQIDVAAWNAVRLGSIQDLGCGIGKSATATAAAITAARIGRCSNERCFIFCPLNAVPQWQAYLIDLRETFKQVDVFTVDSLHHLQGIGRQEGGALIIDEAHKLKSYGADRTAEAHDLRPAFQWAVCLTGTLLHTGPEGVLSVQDLACPGLSRFIDKWAFGEAFNCIIDKKIQTKSGHIHRKSLVKPDAKHTALFERYLVRSTRSLRFESEEVKKVFTIPDHTRVTVTEFPESGWKTKLVFDDLPSGEDLFSKTLEQKIQYIDPATTDIEILAPATAIALMLENRTKHSAWLTSLSEEEKRYLPEEDLIPPGIPSFSSVVWEIMRYGWEDLVLEFTEFELNGLPLKGYKFSRPPGSNPAFGSKLLWLQEWLDSLDVGEQVVIGAAAVDTINLIQALFMQMNLNYRLIRGGVSTKDRGEFIRDFQKSKFKVMLLQQVAGSESVTLTKARYSVIVDHDYSPITYTQFIHRTYRRGQKQTTKHFDLVFNSMQNRLLQRLKSGEAFDAKVREEIEKLSKFDRFKLTFPMEISK